jgi:hypothetical protein
MRRLGFVLATALAVALVPAGPSCLPPPDGCTPTATRCVGQRAEICDGATRWSLDMDCSEVSAQSGGSWVCCAFDAGDGLTEHTCLPAADCHGGAS